MASSYSQENKYDNINLFQQENMGMLAQLMTLKQGTVDTNKQALESLKQHLGVEIDLLRGEDQEYLQKRLGQALNIVQSSLDGGADLSSADVGMSLYNQLKETVNDKNIMNAVSSSIAGRRLMSEIEDKRVNSPDKYNERNAHVAMKGLQQYMNSTGIGNVYKGGEYTDFVDINKKFQSKEFSEFLKNHGINAEWIVREDGSGYFKQIASYEGTYDQNRLMQAVESFMGEDGYRQMGIDAEYFFGEGDDPAKYEVMMQTYNSQAQNVMEQLQKEINAIDTKLNSMPEGAAKKEYQDLRNNLAEQLSNKSDMDFNRLVSNPDGTLNRGAFMNVSRQIYSQGKVNDMFSLVYQTPRLTDLKVDDVDYKTKQFKLELDEFDFRKDEAVRDQANKDRDYELKLAKARFGEGNVKVDKNGNIIMDDPDPTEGMSLALNPEDQDYAVKQLDKDNRDAYFKAVNGVQGLFQGFNKGTAIELGKFLTQNPDWVGQDTIKVNGQVIDFNKNPEAKRKILEFQNAYNGENGYRKRAQEATFEYYKEASGLLMKSFKEGGNSVYNATASGESDYYFKEMSDGSYKWVKGKINPGKGSNHANLIRKANEKGENSLTKAEKATLDYYNMKAILTHDENLKESDRQNMYRAVLDNIHKQVGAKGVNQIPDYKVVDKLTRPDKTALQYVGTALRVVRGVSSLGLSEGVQRIADDGGISRDYLRESKKAYNVLETSINSLQGETGNANRRSVIITPTSPMYSNIINQLTGVPEGYKGKIIVTRSNDLKTMSVDIEQTTGTTKDGKTTGRVTVASNIDPNTFNLPLTPTEPSPYDTSLNNPLALNLGSSADKSKLGSVGYNPIPESMRTLFSTLGNVVTDENKEIYNNLLTHFKEGKINFALEPNGKGGTYSYNAILNNNDRIQLQDLGVGYLGYDEIEDYIVNARAYNAGLMYEYLKQLTK